MPNVKIEKCPYCGNDTFIDGVFRTLLPTQVTNEVSVIGISIDQYDSKEMYAIKTKVCNNCGFTIPYVPLKPTQVGTFIPIRAQVIDHRTFEVYFNQAFSNSDNLNFGFTVTATPTPAFKIDKDGIKIDAFQRNKLIFKTDTDIQKDQIIKLYYEPQKGYPIASADTNLELTRIDGYDVYNNLSGNYIIISSCYAESDGVTLHAVLDENINLSLSDIQKARFSFSKDTSIGSYRSLREIVPEVIGNAPYTNKIKFILNTEDAITYADNLISEIKYERSTDASNDVVARNGMILNTQAVKIDCTNVPNIQRREVILKYNTIGAQNVVLATDLDAATIKYVLRDRIQVSTTGFSTTPAEYPFYILPKEQQILPGFLLIEVGGLEENKSYKFRFEIDSTKTKLYKQYSNIAEATTAVAMQPVLGKLSIIPDLSDIDYNTWSTFFVWSNMDSDFVSADLMVQLPGTSTYTKINYGIYPSTPSTYRYDGMEKNKTYIFKIIEHCKSGKNKESVPLTITPKVFDLNLKITPTTSTQAMLIWESKDTSFKNFVTDILYKPDGASAYAPFNASDSVGDINSYLAKGLITGKKYWFKVIAHDNNGNYGISNEVSITLVSNPPTLTFAATSNPNNFDINWTDVKNVTAGYLRYKRSDALAPLSSKSYNDSQIISYVSDGTLRPLKVFIPSGEAWKVQLEIEGGPNDGFSNEIELAVHPDYKLQLSNLGVTKSSGQVLATSTNFEIGDSSECVYQISISSDGGKTFKLLTEGIPTIPSVPTTISPYSSNFDKYVPNDVTITINYGTGVTLNSIKSEVATLSPGVDYMIIGSTVVLLKTYLKSLTTNDIMTFTLSFSDGTSMTTDVNVIDNTPIAVPGSLDTTTIIHDKILSNSDKSLTIISGTVSKIETSKLTLVNGTHYSIVGNKINLYSSYLNSLALGSSTMAVVFEGGSVVWVSLTIKSTIDLKLTQKSSSASSVTLTWELGQPGVKNIDLTVIRKSSNTFVKSASGLTTSSTEYTFTGLSSGVEYKILLTIAYGDGSWADQSLTCILSSSGSGGDSSGGTGGTGSGGVDNTGGVSTPVLLSISGTNLTVSLKDMDVCNQYIHHISMFGAPMSDPTASITQPVNGWSDVIFTNRTDTYDAFMKGHGYNIVTSSDASIESGIGLSGSTLWGGKTSWNFSVDPGYAFVAVIIFEDGTPQTVLDKYKAEQHYGSTGYGETGTGCVSNIVKATN